jgi:opacity protein-like surface antigen
MIKIELRTSVWIAFWGFISLAFVAVSAQAQSDVALSIYGAFNGSTNGNGVQQSPSNSAGGMLELRHIGNPLMGYDVTYSYNRDNQTYHAITYALCGVCSGGPTWTPVSANAHELTGDWVVSVKVAKLRPFALGGIGLLLNEPTSGQTTTTTYVTACGGGNPGCTPGSTVTSTTSTSSSTKPVFVYGAGLDWGLLPHLGLRLQYRGNVYKAPNLTRAYTSTGAFTHSSEPMIGAYFRF